MTTISVIVPLYQGERYLARVLPPLAEALERGEVEEVLVVDDGSTDRGPSLCEAQGARLLSSKTRRGPGAARNQGAAEASGEVLLFLDADTVMHADVPRLVRETFEQHPDAAAMIGSYDDKPAHPGWVSQYRNLLHHYIHQRGAREASTFWGGCGAVRRSVFSAMGGFDTQRYGQASIEDIEFGQRLRSQGNQILLQKQIQVKHLKHWTLRNLLFTDIFRRARPWSRLLLDSPTTARQLNLSIGERLRAVLALCFWASLPFAPFSKWTLLLSAALLLLSWAASARFYALVLRCAGIGPALTAMVLHQLYYLYSSAVYAYSWFEHRLGRRGERKQAHA